jgi:hypothetical protein
MAKSMLRLWLILLILFPLFASCKKMGLHGQSQSTTPSDSLKASDRPSDSSGGVPGYLTLGCKTSFSEDGIAVESACVAKDKTEKAKLSGLANSWTWQYTLPTDATPETVVSVIELSQDNPYHVIFRYSGRGREVLLQQALRYQFGLIFQLKNSKSIDMLNESIDRVIDISPAPRYRFIRISFPSLKQPWLDTQELDIERLEFKWEKQWRIGVFSDFSGRMGPYEAIVSASSYAVDRNSLPFFAFQRGPQGNIWESALHTYETTGQYNAIGSPQWLKVDFKNYPIALEGIRIDGGDSRDTAGSEGSPDSFYIEGSQDDISWTLIEGSRMENVDTTSLTTFEWDK